LRLVLAAETRQQYEAQAEDNRAETAQQALGAGGAAEHAVQGGLTAEEVRRLPGVPTEVWTSSAAHMGREPRVQDEQRQRLHGSWGLDFRRAAPCTPC
jgi:hypothetical protein